MWNFFRRRPIEPVVPGDVPPAPEPSEYLREEIERASLVALSRRSAAAAAIDKIHQSIADGALRNIRGRGR